MADMVLGIALRMIIKAASKINDVMEAVRQNEEECLEAQELVAIVVPFLLHLKAAKEDPLKDMMAMTIEKDMNRLLSDVTSWQKRRGKVWCWITARAMNRKLLRTRDKIDRKLSRCKFILKDSYPHTPLTQPLQCKIVIKVEVVRSGDITLNSFVQIRGVLYILMNSEKSVLELVCYNGVDPVAALSLLYRMMVPAFLVGVVALSAEEAYRAMAPPYLAAPKWHCGVATNVKGKEKHGAVTGEAGPSRTRRNVHMMASDSEDSSSPAWQRRSSSPGPSSSDSDESQCPCPSQAVNAKGKQVMAAQRHQKVRPHVHARPDGQSPRGFMADARRRPMPRQDRTA